jgi:hypothetical protein
MSDKKRPRQNTLWKGIGGGDQALRGRSRYFCYAFSREVTWKWRMGEVALNNQEHPVVGSAKANYAVIAILINSGFIDAPKSPGKPGFRL